MYRIYDSICQSCDYFEHECYDEGCAEFCKNIKAEVKENFYNNDKPINECEGFKD